MKQYSIRALCVEVEDYIQGSDNDFSAPPCDVDKIRQFYNNADRVVHLAIMSI